MAVSGINALGNVLSPAVRSNSIDAAQDNNISFSDFLNNALGKVNDLINQSDQISTEFAAGKTDNIHQVMIAAEKADIAIQLTMQIRNKLMDAYNEIMRMQV